MNIINKSYNIKKYNNFTINSKIYIRKKNLNDLIEILSIAIDTKDKSLLIYLINRWKCYYVNISIENNHQYIINNSNQLNYVNFLIKDAKYITKYE
jgi:hypothetical protein